MLTVVLVAFAAAALTLFSGFGLGTLLLPAFALAFPLEVAVAATAVVHLANNLFKLVLLGRHADRSVVLRFALPATIAAIAGALLLARLARAVPLATWRVGAHAFEITPLGLTVGVLIVVFALLELHPRAATLAFPRAWLPVGGIVSGFLGGLSGHQGALRTAFLLRLGLAREAFLASGIVCAVCIDIARLGVYGASFWGDRLAKLDDARSHVVAGMVAAFCGSFLGARLVKKVTMRAIQLLVGVMLALLGMAMASGLLGAH